MAGASENRPEFRPGEFTGAFLHKPFKVDDLLRKTDELLRRAPVVPAKA